MASVRVRPIVVALIAIVAIGIAAATLNTAVVTDESSLIGGGGGGSAEQGGGSQGGEAGRPFSLGLGEQFEGGEPYIPFPCYPFLEDPQYIMGLLLFVLVGSYLLKRRYNILVPLAILSVATPPAVLIHALFTACRTASEPGVGLLGGNQSARISVGAGSGSGGGAPGATPTTGLVLFAILGIALVVAVVMLLQTSGDDVTEEIEEPTSVQQPQAAIADAAGRAADRLENDANTDNEVYRAWREMTEYLDVSNPRSSTPAEFASAAVEAGMVREDVDELTRLFEEVRYGGAEPTPDREERAIETFRRIEDTYGSDGPDTDEDDTGWGSDRSIDDPDLSGDRT
ncbi:MAG: DUF4129 domain-containing protein [Halobacteriales archaeon]|nr:DUF4129 domain-containing protein [Halobacteriales archaeon]